LLSLFLDLPRAALLRRLIFVALIALTVLLFGSALEALRSSGPTAGRILHHLSLFGVAGLGLAVFLAAATWLAYRYPDWAMPVVVVLAPLRLELPLGTRSSDLLVPLYLVLLAVAIAELVVRDRLRVPEGRRTDPVRIALAVMVAVIGLSALWAGHGYVSDVKAFADALIKLFAFYLPFVVLYYVVYRYAADVGKLSRLLTTFVAAGAVLAVIGLIEVPTHLVIVNRAAAAHARALGQTFRANSLFFDPNVFGRFLALVVIVGAALYLAALLREPSAQRRRALRLIAIAAGLAAAALVATVSRSSVTGLLIGAVVLEMAWLGRRKGGVVALVTLLVLLAGVGGFTALRLPQQLPSRVLSVKGLNRITSGRVYLIQAGGRMFVKHPLAGLGLASFPVAYPSFRGTPTESLAVRDSHTTVMTVAAEQGLLGLAALAGLLVTFFATTLHKRRFGADRRLYLWQAALVACVLSVFVHSMTYNAFFEDPYTWLFMALASAVATRIVLVDPLARQVAGADAADVAVATGRRRALRRPPPTPSPSSRAGSG
jgi:O-antigen ligase